MSVVCPRLSASSDAAERVIGTGECTNASFTILSSMAERDLRIGRPTKRKGGEGEPRNGIGLPLTLPSPSTSQGIYLRWP